ncbi:MAG: hemolysin family protein [Marmoricola sp.]
MLTGAEAALASFSRARAEELRDLRRAGSRRLLEVLADPPPYLNTALFLRTLCEVAAVVVATLMITGSYGRNAGAIVAAVAVMVVISFVVLGVAPRTLGRQHADAVALASAGVLRLLTQVLGPIPRLLILLGNALTPGRGFTDGPFSSEAELREMVDLAEASSLIESGERAMIHSVFELGDTTVREVMVPRTDVVFIERHRTLRQAMSLFLRSGYSRVPVVGEDLDDIVGFAYLKDISKRVFDRADAQTTEQVESVMRPVLHVPDSKPVDDLLREMQAARRHIAVVVDEYGGTAGLVTIEDVLEEIVGEITDEFDAEEVSPEALPDGSVRVSSRFPVDDLEDLTGVEIDDADADDVDSVGGLMAKHLGKVPIPGSVVRVGGLVLEAEGTTGRRKRIGTVVITPVVADAGVVEDPARPDDAARVTG